MRFGSVTKAGTAVEEHSFSYASMRSANPRALAPVAHFDNAGRKRRLLINFHVFFKEPS